MNNLCNLNNALIPTLVEYIWLIRWFWSSISFRNLANILSQFRQLNNWEFTSLALEQKMNLIFLCYSSLSLSPKIKHWQNWSNLGRFCVLLPTTRWMVNMVNKGQQKINKEWWHDHVQRVTWQQFYFLNLKNLVFFLLNIAHPNRLGLLNKLC